MGDQIEFIINESEIIIEDVIDEPVEFKYSITSYGADYPVDSLVKRLDAMAILIPNFQRSYVWTLTQASRFIESLLLGLPVPGIFLSKESGTQKLLVIDGQQRLKSLHMFYSGKFNGAKEFALKGVQAALEGKTYKSLNSEDKIRLDDSIIHATVIKQDEPSDDESSIYHIFERLNTGGTPLHPQEIRACIYHGEFNELLEELRKNTYWVKLYGNTSARLKDQELILRFLALYFDFNNYKKPLKEFLNKYMAKNRELKVNGSESIRLVFEPTIKFISTTIGKNAFRLNQVFVAAVFDAVMVATAKRLEKGEINVVKYILAYEKLLKSEEFISTCKAGTSDESAVEKRLRLAYESIIEV